jgi:hemoglobin
LIDVLCDRPGGPLFYSGRDMGVSHQGMNISTDDWRSFVNHLEATLDHCGLPAAERADVLAFVDSTREDIVE